MIVSMLFSKTRAKIKNRATQLLVLSGNHPRRAATSPRMYTAKDWRYVLLETRYALKDKKIPLLAAGTAFYASLAFFPLLAATIAVIAHTVNYDELNKALMAIKIYFPIDIAALIGSQLRDAYEYNVRNIVVAAIALIIGLYSATRAMSTLISSVHTAYEKVEVRSKARQFALSLLMSLVAIILLAIVLIIVLVDDTALMRLGIDSFLSESLPILRWVILTVIIAVSLAIFYRVAPSNHDPHWKWVSWGACIASVIWLAGTTLFFLYAKLITMYSNIYSVFGSVIVLLIWLNLSAFVILLGAQINHQLELRTTRRTSK
jgi:membrane protein